MDPTVPTPPNPEELNQVPPTSVSTTPEVKKSGNLITILAMAVFVLLSLGAVAFLYYQNQQLKGILTSYQLQQGQTPIPSADPTANWLTFNHSFGYSLKYPTNIQIISMKGQGEDTTPDPEFPDIVFSASTGFEKPHLRVIRLTKEFVTSSGQSLMSAANDHYQANLNRKGLPATSVQAPEQGTFLGIPSVNYILKSKGFHGITDEYFGFEGEYNAVWLDRDGYRYFIYWTGDVVIEEILSTFKFSTQASSSATPTAKACTMEAKLCPNGSYVGRSGPNCEFAACPTSTPSN